MNTNNLSSLIIIDGLKTIKVIFDYSGKKYTYKTVDDSIEVGDHVIVEARKHYQVVRVVKVDNIPDLSKDNIDYKWIIQKLDTTKMDELIKIEENASEKLRMLEKENMIINAKVMLSKKLGIDESLLLEKLK